ncbi:MAG: zinc ABC transporter substrate-binding protein [Pseudomonadota bacterium]
MKNKILLLVLTLFVSVNAYAKPKIATSITPIASIVSMLTESNAEISAINVSAGCPHHYQMKPSDKEKIVDAKILIYIDEHFDGYASHLIPNFKGKVVKISDFKSITFLGEEGETNWHFWLDLDNVQAFQKELAEIIKSEIPELAKIIDDNMNKAQAKIESLKRLKKYDLASHGEIVVLSHSLDHFVNDMVGSIIKLYQKHSSSLKDLDNLEYILNTDQPQCIVIDSMQDSKTYKKYKKKIVQLEAENWEMPNDMSDSSDLFCTKYLKMINQLKTCR